MNGTDHIRRTGGERAVVLLHGIGAGAEMFAPQIEGLGQDHDAIAGTFPATAAPRCCRR